MKFAQKYVKLLTTHLNVAYGLLLVYFNIAHLNKRVHVYEFTSN